jgi:hypothetical protein
MKRTAAAGLALGFLSAILVLNGCDEAEELLECRQICDAKEECETSGYDVDACVDECETRADQSQSYRLSVSACEECIEDLACAEQRSQCAEPCSILPTF